MNGTLSKSSLFVFLAASILTVTAVASAQQASGQNVRITESAAAARVDRVTALTNFLALSSDQEEQAKVIFEDEDPITRPLAGQLKQAADALRAAEQTEAADSEIDQLARNVANILSQLLAAEAKADIKVYALLTAGQKQKLDQLPQMSFMPESFILAVPVMVSRSSTSSGQ